MGIYIYIYIYIYSERDCRIRYRDISKTYREKH